MIRHGAHGSAADASRRTRQSWQVCAFSAPSLIGTGGLLAAPTTTPWLWALAIGLGTPSVVVALALISLRTREAEHTAALSSMVHGVGYVIAGVVISVVSALHGLTGSWAWPLRVLMVVLIAQLIVGIRAARPGTVVAARDTNPPTVTSPREANLRPPWPSRIRRHRAHRPHPATRRPPRQRR
jgi:CP family cyanate transporter-like MFS transporter